MSSASSSASLRRLLPAALLAAALMAGCTSVGVRPWQRDVLAGEDMRFDANSLDATFDDHMYFAKEASSGGRAFAGGGCGCN